MNSFIVPVDLTKKSRTEEEHFFISEISRAIKDVQYLSTTSVSGMCISSKDWQLQRLTECLDHLFSYGLKNYIKGYFEVFREFTHQSISIEILKLKNITTDIGKSRAWLLCALRDHLLGSYIFCAKSEAKYMTRFYESQSVFFDEQKIEILITLLSGLENINFFVDLDVDYLDLYCFNALTSSITSDEAVPVLSIDASTKDRRASLESNSLPSDHLDSARPDIHLQEEEMERSTLDSNDVIVEHLPRKRKKVKKCKDKDDCSISSDSMSVFVPEAIVHSIHSNDSNDWAVRLTPANERKSIESFHFDKLFEEIVFGKKAVHSNCVEDDKVGIDQKASDGGKPVECKTRDDDLGAESSPEAKSVDESFEQTFCHELLEVRDEVVKVQEVFQDVESIKELALSDDNSLGNVEDHGTEDHVVKDVVAVGVGRAREVVDVVESQRVESPDRAVRRLDGSFEKQENPCEIRISNNLKVLLLLDVFKLEEEVFFKAFQAFQNFMEGGPVPLLVVLTSSSVYFLVPLGRRLKLHCHIPYMELGILSVGLDEQSLDFVSRDKSRYSVSTCDPELTRSLVRGISQVTGEQPSLGEIVVLRDATNQKISIKRWIAGLHPDRKASCDAIKGFFLASYRVDGDDRDLRKRCTGKRVVRRGPLYVLTPVMHHHGVATLWKKATFVLRESTLHEYKDDDLKTEVSSYQLSEWLDCKRCGGSVSGRKHCFSLVPRLTSATEKSSRESDFKKSRDGRRLSFNQLFQSVSSRLQSVSSVDNHKALPMLTFSAKTKEEAKEWVYLLKSVIENKGIKIEYGASGNTGCCVILNDAVHLISMNSLSCHVQSLASFPIADARHAVLSAKRVSLSFCRRSVEQETISSSTSLEDFELVNFDEVEGGGNWDRDGLQDGRLPEPRSVENFGPTLELHFRSSEEKQRFSALVRSLHSRTTGADLRSTNDPEGSKEGLEVYELFDWNSLEGTIT